MSILMCMPDPLHTKHIGTDGYYAGSTIRYLTHHILSGNVDDNLRVIVHDIKAAYKNHGIHRDRFSFLKHTSIQGSSAKIPFLKGSGAQIRKMMVVLQSIFAKYMDPEDTTHQLVMQGLSESVAIDKVLLRNIGEYALPSADAAILKTAAFGFNQTVTKLVKIMRRDGLPLFHFTMKNHYLCHIGLNASFTNPNIASCESGEDMMKVVKRLISSSARGNKPHAAARLAMYKYTFALGFALNGDKWMISR